VCISRGGAAAVAILNAHLPTSAQATKELLVLAVGAPSVRLLAQVAYLLCARVPFQLEPLLKHGTVHPRQHELLTTFQLRIFLYRHLETMIAVGSQLLLLRNDVFVRASDEHEGNTMSTEPFAVYPVSF
jgi:hypothetical protein